MASGLAGIYPVLDARALDAVGADRERYGRLRVWGSASFIAAAFLVGVLMERTDVRVIFAVFVPALLITGLIGSSLPQARDRSSHRIVSGSSTVLRHPEIAWFLVAALATWAMFIAATSLLSVYLSRLGVPEGTIGLVWAVAAVMELPVMWAFPALARRFGVERLLVFGALMFALRAAGYALTDDAALLIAISGLAGVGFALFLVGGVTYVGSKAPQGLAATAQGILTGVSFGLATVLGSGLGGAVAGALTIPGLFAACALLGLLATVGVHLAVSRARHEPSIAGLAWDTQEP